MLSPLRAQRKRPPRQLLFRGIRFRDIRRYGDRRSARRYDRNVGGTRRCRESGAAYYKNTVFEVVSLDVKSATADKVVFTVKAKRGGELLEQQRSIELTLTGGTWTVTGEGY